MPHNPRTEGADTARRALKILELVSKAEDPISLDEISRRTELGKSMAYRLIRALQEELYIERADGGGYVGGSQLFTLAASALPNFDNHSAYLPLLRAIADETGETSALHRRAGNRVVLLLGAESAQSLRWVWQPGEVTPLHRGSAGVAILSNLAPVDLDAALEGIGEEAATSARPEVQRAYERGFALSFGANHPGLHGIAVPVPGQDMSISVSGPAGRWSEKKMIALAPRLIKMVGSYGDSSPGL